MMLRILFNCALLIFLAEFAVGWGDRDLKSEAAKLRRLDPNRPILYHRMRSDGAGAEITPMVLFAAFAHYRGMTYGGGIRGTDKGVQHNIDVAILADFVFGRHVAYAMEQSYQLKELKNEISVYHPKELIGPPWQHDYYRLNMMDVGGEFKSYFGHKKIPYPQLLLDLKGPPPMDPTYNVYNMIVSPEFLAEIRGNNSMMTVKQDIVFNRNSKMTVAMHVRHGDAELHKDRLTSHAYYLTLADRVRNVYPDADIHVFSALENVTDVSVFESFKEKNIPVHLEDTAPAVVAWTNMIAADILVMALSEFSMVPAIIRPKCVVFQPKFFHYIGVMDEWVTSDGMDDEFIKSCSRRK